MNTSTWPKHEDGTNKRVGEMTPEEKRAVIADAAERFKRSGMDNRSLAVLDRVLASA